MLQPAVDRRADSRAPEVLTVAEVRDVETFQALEESWDSCAAEDAGGGFFSSHAWFSCCIRSFGQGKQLRILVLRAGGRVVAIAPLWQEIRVRRRVRVRTVAFIDTPESQRTDFIVATPDRQGVMRAILDVLLAPAGPGWDLLELTRWPEASPNVAALGGELRRREIQHSESTSALLPFIRATGTWDAFLQSKSAKFRKTHRNISNRVERLPGVRLLRLTEPASLPLFDKLIEVSLKSWKQEAGISMSAETARGRFFQCVTTAAARRGAWLGWILEADGRQIAMEYDLVSDGVVYAIRSDFDAAYAAYSPGAYLEQQIIKAVFDLGYREYNAGPGVDGYKLRWTDETRRNLTVTAYNRTVRGRTLGGVETVIVPAARRMADATKSPLLRRRPPTVAS